MASIERREVRKGRWRLLAAAMIAVSGVAPAVAADKTSNGATLRAAAYQTETREVLKKHHWRITADGPGKLIARHVLGPGGGDLGGAYAEAAGYARLTILFKPLSSTDTAITASIVAVHVESTTGDGKYVFAEPVPFNNPKATQSVQELLAEGRQHMVAAHPEYAGR